MPPTEEEGAAQEQEPSLKLTAPPKEDPPEFPWSVEASSTKIERPITLGTDYGNPRVGINTFDFIMFQLNAPLKAGVTASDSASGTTSTECK